MRVITIMPDWGGAPYAWLKQEDDGTTLVGGCIADADNGFEFSEFWVPPGLEQAFADWMGEFGSNCDDANADWASFHERGIELSRRLKEHLADQVRVIYDKTGEDPDAAYGSMTERIEVFADGTLKRITVRLWSPP